MSLVELFVEEPLELVGASPIFRHCEHGMVYLRNIKFGRLSSELYFSLGIGNETNGHSFVSKQV